MSRRPGTSSRGSAGRCPSGGAIVNLSSSSAKLATTTEAAVYASSKAAVLSITRSFAYAFAPNGVRVNAICPGIIDTPMQDKVLADVAAKRGMTVEELSTARNKTVPLGRAASADECAGAIWFLLSDEAGYMTGQAINYTGGPGDVVRPGEATILSGNVDALPVGNDTGPSLGLEAARSSPRTSRRSANHADHDHEGSWQCSRRWRSSSRACSTPAATTAPSAAQSQAASAAPSEAAASRRPERPAVHGNAQGRLHVHAQPACR